MVDNTNRNKQFIGHLASFAAYAIFGFNIVFCKDIAREGGIPPVALFTMRAVVAGILFWLLSIALPKEKVEKKDLFKMVAAALVGLFIPQMTFLSAITCTTTIDTSILSSLTPIMTMFVAAIFLKEPITFKKAGGVAISFAGVIYLIFNSVHASNGIDSTSPWGVALLILNTLSFASYLGIFRPLINRYSVVTLMKWMFLFAFIISLPFSAMPLLQVNYAAISSKIWLEIGFLIIFATFFAYFLIPIGQKNIRPTLVSMYSYLQPIIATLIAIIIGTDSLSWQKVIAAALVFAGITIVNRSRAAQTSTHKE